MIYVKKNSPQTQLERVFTTRLVFINGHLIIFYFATLNYLFYYICYGFVGLVLHILFVSRFISQNLSRISLSEQFERLYFFPIVKNFSSSRAIYTCPDCGNYCEVGKPCKCYKR